MFDLDKQPIQVFAKHPLDHSGPYSSIPVFATNRAVELIQNGVMDFVIGVHHSLKITFVIDIQQWNDMRIAIANMAKDGQRNFGFAKVVIQIANQLANSFGCHDHIIDIVNRFFLCVISIESRIEGLSRFP